MSTSDRIKAAIATGKAMAADKTDTDVDQLAFASDTSGQANVGNMATKAVGLVVGLMVGGLVAAFLLPVAIDEIVAVDTSSWGSGASSLWGIMDVIIVLAVFLFFIGIALAATNKL